MVISTTLSKKTLNKIYLQGNSMAEIANKYNCSINRIVYWMNKYNIKRRSNSDAAYIKQNPNGDPFKIKNNLNLKEQQLFGLGIGIYWGEGDKTNPHSSRVANTDPRLIKVFIRFLKKICQLENRKIRYSIVCFNDSNTDECKSYWAKQLGISTNKFGKIVQIPSQGKGTYKRKSKYGVCTVSATNVKLKKWIMKQIYMISPVSSTAEQ